MNLKLIAINIIKINNGINLQTVTIVFTKLAFSIPLITKKVNIHKKIIDMKIEAVFCPPLKILIKFPIAAIKNVASAKLPTQAEIQYVQS